MKDNLNFNFDDIYNSNIYDCDIDHTTVKENKQSYHIILKENIFNKNKVRLNYCHNIRWLPVKEHIVNHQLNNLFVFAEDKPYMKNGKENHCYQYYALDYDTVFKLSYQKMFHLFECFEGDEKIKLFLDIDIKNDSKYIVNLKSDKKKQDVLNQIIDEAIKLVLDKINELNQNKINDAKILIMKSDSNMKLSAHIIFQNIVFENVYHIKYLFSLLNSELINDKILDDSIYRRGTFRMLWNSKAYKNINLEMSRTINYQFINDKTLFMDCLLKNLPNEYHLIKLDTPNIDKPVLKNIKQHKKLNKDDILNINNEIIYSSAYLKRYIDILDNNRVDKYTEWLQIITCIINCNPTQDGFDLFHIWAKTGSSYVSINDCIYYWNLMQKYNYKSHIGTLKFLAKKDNPEKYSEIESSMDLPTYESIKIIDEYLINKDKKLSEQNNLVCHKIDEWVNTDKDIGDSFINEYR